MAELFVFIPIIGISVWISLLNDIHVLHPTGRTVQTLVYFLLVVIGIYIFAKRSKEVEAAGKEVSVGSLMSDPMPIVYLLGLSTLPNALVYLSAWDKNCAVTSVTQVNHTVRGDWFTVATLNDNADIEIGARYLWPTVRNLIGRSPQVGERIQIFSRSGKLGTVVEEISLNKGCH